MSEKEFAYVYDEDNRTLDLYINEVYQYTIVDCRKDEINSVFNAFKEHNEAIY
jgi:hypothetical protein